MKDEGFWNAPILVVSIFYLIFTWIHFGLAFYDLDRLITNTVIGILGVYISYSYKKQENRGKDIGAIDKRLNNLEAKFIDHKNGY